MAMDKGKIELGSVKNYEPMHDGKLTQPRVKTQKKQSGAKKSR